MATKTQSQRANADPGPPKAKRVTPYFGTTLAPEYTQVLDEISATVGFARVAAGLHPSIGRAGVLRGIIEGVKRLELDFSSAASPEDIADLIAGTKPRTRR